MTHLLYRLGPPLILWGMVSIFGPRSTLYVGGGLTALAAAFLLILLHDRLRIQQLQRKGCDDAICYARKKRLAFGEPDYTESELAEMKAPRSKGDFRQVHALILASNLRLLDKQQSEQRHAMAEAQKATSAIRQRDKDVRMYRA